MNSNYSNFKKQLNYFQTEAGRMAYMDQGSGECILLLHGVPTNCWLYRKIIPTLVEKGYRVVAPDMIGYGGSDKPDDYDIYSNEKMGSRILALMAHLEIPSWTHVFHDAGGLWTWEMLRQNSSCVDRLIMLNTIVYKEGFKPPFTLKKGAIAKIYSKFYCSPLGQKFMFYMTMKGGMTNDKSITSEMLDGYKLPLRDGGRYAMYYFFTTIGKALPKLAAMHQSLKMPLSIIWGKDDEILVFEAIREQVKKNFDVDDSSIHVLEGKHFIQEENSEEVAALIVSEMEK